MAKRLEEIHADLTNALAADPLDKDALLLVATSLKEKIDEMESRRQAKATADTAEKGSNGITAADSVRKALHRPMPPAWAAGVPKGDEAKPQDSLDDPKRY